MKLTFVKGIALGAATSMLTLGATSALAGTGIGAVFNLGKVNSVNATSTLTGSATGSMLHVVNTGTGPAAAFNVAAGKPPFTVNSATEVTNLNAATVDGHPSTDFYAAGSTVANSNLLGGHPPADFYAAGSTVADSSALGGQPPSAFGDRWFAVVNASGGLVAGNGISSTQRFSTGSYAVRFTGNISNAAACAGVAVLEDGAGLVQVTPTNNFSEFDVHTYNTSGTLTDHEFNFYAAC